MKKRTIIRIITNFYNAQSDIVGEHLGEFRAMENDDHYYDFLQETITDADDYLEACEGLKEFKTVSDLIAECDDLYDQYEKWLDNLDEHLKLIENGQIELTEEYLHSHIDWKLRSIRKTVELYDEKACEVRSRYLSWKQNAR